MSDYTFECPKCSEENSAEVDLGEHFVDFEHECLECGYKFTETEIDNIYNSALEDGWGSRIDDAYEKYKDRLLFNNL